MSNNQGSSSRAQPGQNNIAILLAQASETARRQQAAALATQSQFSASSTAPPGQDSDDSEMTVDRPPAGTTSLEDLVTRLGLATQTEGSSLHPGSYLPSFKKGALTEKVAADILHKFVNRAAVLMDKIKAAEKVLQELVKHTAINYWGEPLVNGNRVSLSSDASITLKTKYNELLVDTIRNDKTALIIASQEELDHKLPKNLADTLQTSMVSLETNDRITNAGKDYTRTLMKACAQEFISQVQALRITAELQALNIGLKVLHLIVYPWFAPRLYNILHSSNHSFTSSDLLENQTQSSSRKARERQAIPHQAQERTFQVQGPKRPREGEEQQEERIPRQRPQAQAPGQRQEPVHAKGKGKRPRYRSPTPTPQEEVKPHDVTDFEGVNNISSITAIPHEVLVVLNKGVNFNIHKQPRYDLLKIELLKLRKQIFKKLKGADRYISRVLFDAYKPQLISELVTLRTSNPHRKLLPKINRTIKFMTDNKLIIGPADKNMGLTIMDSNWYQNQMHDLLSERKNYLPDPNFDITEALRYGKRIARLFEEDLYEELIAIFEHMETLLVKDKNYFKVPTMYLLPKIHKTPIGVRPIVPSYPWFTHTASEFVDGQLRDVLRDFPQELPDTPTLIRKLEELELHPDYDYFLHTYDVINMYGNISMYDSKYFINRYFQGDPREKHIFNVMELAYWVNTNCIISDGNNIYRQVKGLAMGTPMAPSYARLYACCVENGNMVMGTPINQVYLNIDDDTHDQLDFLGSEKFDLQIFRYIDDGLALFAVPRYIRDDYPPEVTSDLFGYFDEALHKIYANVNDINITIDHGKYGREVNMLDLTVSIVTENSIQRFDIRPFDKPMNKHLYTNPDTYYPKKYIFNWINGENQRLIRNSSCASYHKVAKENFIQFLINRDYPERVIKEQLQVHDYNERHKLLYGLSALELAQSMVDFTDPEKDEEEDTNKRFFLRNIPGRHKVEHFGRNVVQAILKSNPAKFKDVSATWIIYRGSNIRDELNRYNRKILQHGQIQARL